MPRILLLLVSIWLFMITFASQAIATEPQQLDFSKAWYKPELVENNDPACNDLLKDAQDKFFETPDFDVAHGIQNKRGQVLDWAILSGEEENQIEAYGKTFYLDHINYGGCGGACETTKPLVSDKPFPEERDYDYLRDMAKDAPPAVGYGYSIRKTPENMFYLFMVGTIQEYKNQRLIYKLTPDARWKRACTILLAPKDIQRSQDVDVSAAVKSINNLNHSIIQISGGLGGDCGSMATPNRWRGYVEDSLEEVLYRPWALILSQGGKYGDYKEDFEHIELWSLTGISQYQAFSSYKTQLATSINDISLFYQKKFGWSEQQSTVIAEDALNSAINRGFHFYMYEPKFVLGEERIREAILEKREINEVQAIFFDIKKVDSGFPSYGDLLPEGRESILSIAVDYPEALQYLLEKGIDPNKENGFGKTPLMYAVQRNQEDSVKVLLKSGADSSAETIEPSSKCYYTLQTFKMTPLHYAVRYASPAIIKLLLDSGASPQAKAENHHKYKMVEETPLDWFKRYTSKDAPERNPNIPVDKISEVEGWLQPKNTEKPE